MKRINFFISTMLSGVLVAGTLLGTVSCRTSRCATEQKQSVTESVAYTVADHYFVRNDVQTYKNQVITSQQDFDAQFGAAAVMGEGGLPTAIDFTRQAVLVLMHAPVKSDMELKVKNLSVEKGKLCLHYAEVVKHASLSYSQTPLTMLVVDKSLVSDGVKFVKD